jgi:hypothetical protein
MKELQRQKKVNGHEIALLEVFAQCVVVVVGLGIASKTSILTTTETSQKVTQRSL